MAGELKREGVPDAGASVLPQPGPMQTGLATTSRTPTTSTCCFDAIDPEERLQPRTPRRGYWAAPLFVAALVAVAVVRSLVLRVLLPVALALAAIAVVLKQRKPREATQPPVSRRRLILDENSLSLHVRGQVLAHVLLPMNQPFGVTLLATACRDRLVALLSSSNGTFYVGAAFDAEARRTFASMLARASTLAADEAALEAIGPDGEPLLLSPATFVALVEELSRRSSGCLDRFVLTDARGTTLRLEGRELSAGGRSFDLGAPLEWRAFIFQEAVGQAIALYQGTYVRQGSSELALVCLLPSITPTPQGERVSLSSLDLSALRDLRLMQGAPDDPPPADQRVAIDRLLMLPIRSALDKAPRPAAQPPQARA